MCFFIGNHEGVDFFSLLWVTTEGYEVIGVKDDDGIVIWFNVVDFRQDLGSPRWLGELHTD